jgi:transposase-like protein
MGAEMNLRLGYPAGQSKPPGQANERNGASGKTVITDRGPVRVNVPRDRDGSFESILIPKHERRFTGVDERIIAMYGRGVSVREIQGFLAEHYGTEVSPAFISSVTDEVMAEASSWQNAGASEERLRSERQADRRGESIQPCAVLLRSGRQSGARTYG